MEPEFDVRNRIDRESETTEVANSSNEMMSPANDVFTVQTLPNGSNLVRNDPELQL